MIDRSYGKTTGEIKTNKGDIVNPVFVNLFNDGNLIDQRIGGPYVFGDLIGNNTYVVVPSRNDDHINGVSTQDITILRKHILGKSMITNPYILIAGDVNNSKSITMSDASEIRRLILCDKMEFSKVSSWTFVPNAYQFQESFNPWNAPRMGTVYFSNPSTSETRILDFIGIKMGDVSENARASNLIDIDSRNSKVVNLYLAKQVISKNELLIHINVRDLINFKGIQFTFEFDNLNYEYIGFDSEIISLDDENLGFRNLDKGFVSFSWDAIEDVFIKQNSKLLSFRFKKLNELADSGFKISSRITKAVAYSNNEEYKIRSLEITDLGNSRIELLNTLVSDGIQLVFVSSQSKIADIQIFGIDGKVHITLKMQISHGINVVDNSRISDLERGIYFMKVKTNGTTYTEKFITTN